MERNIRLYPWFVAAIESMAWLPVFFLYFNSVLSIQEVVLLESIYYFSVVLLEVPSGYFSDRIGRKVTLTMSSIFFCLSYLVFISSNSFEFFAIGQILLAGGMSFASGTKTSFHFESLKMLGKESEYGAREAKVFRISWAAGAVAVFVGGLLASYALHWPYVLSFALTLFAVIIAFFFQEPTSNSGKATPAFLHQIKTCFSYLKNKTLAWLFFYVFALYVLVHVPYEFYQPYLAFLEDADELKFGDAPLISGIVYAITKLFGSWAGGNSIRWRDRIGLPKLLFFAFLSILIVIFFMGLLLHPIIILVVFVRSMPMSMLKASINAEIAPRIKEMQRATFFSIQSLVNRCGFGILLIMTSFVLGEENNWAQYQLMMLSCAFIGVVSAVILWTIRGDKLNFLYANKNGDPTK